MNRVFKIHIAVLLMGAVFVGAGCSTPGQRLTAVAIAVRPVGNRPPSTEEIRRIHDSLQPALIRMGASVAQSREGADLVMTVDFIPATGDSGPRVKVIGVEPTARFREATDGGDTPEANDWRRRQREMEAWAERQGRGLDP